MVMKRERDNIILMADAYKYTHHRQYPFGTEGVYSYLESRGGKWPETVFFGLQYFIKRYLEGVVVFHEDILEAEQKINKVFGYDYFNKEGWMYILDSYEGRLPIRISAVNEGSVNPNHTCLMAIENTDKDCFWLTNFIETLISNVWYPCTVATEAYKIKELIRKYTDMAGEKVNPCHLNDFGMRGCSCPEQAGLGGAAHLTSWLGTDNIVGIELARNYYNAVDPIGVSVAAAEHSTITAYGRDGECRAYQHILQQYPDDAYVSLVCDSYDTRNAVEEIFGWDIFEQVSHRKGKTVIRPDSGNPVAISMMVMQKLHECFGAPPSKTGYHTLPPHVGMIYGDGINYDTIKQILDSLVVSAKYSPSNIVFGSGGALLQNHNRDSQKFAFKCSAVKNNGEWVPVRKEPVTDPGKWSKAGRVGDDLYPVFRNGRLLLEHDFDDIRKRLEV